MSWQATAWAARQKAGNSGRKTILLLIANRADISGVGWPGRALLAEEAECRPETVTAHLAALEHAGLIARHQRRRKNGSRTTDWVVLAPRAKDRGEMHNADTDEVPGYIASDAKQESGWDSSPEDFGRPQVRISGGPEQSVEQDGERGGARVRPMRVSGKPVQPDAWATTDVLLADFNAQTGRHLRLTTSAGQPSEAAKRIYGRVLAYPDLSREDFHRIITNTLASKWWGSERSTIGVVFGPNVFEENITRKPRVRGGASLPVPVVVQTFEAARDAILDLGRYRSTTPDNAADLLRHAGHTRAASWVESVGWIETMRLAREGLSTGWAS